MKTRNELDSNIKEEEIVIRCRAATEEIQRLYETLSNNTSKEHGLGLFVGGCIFNYLNEKCQNIYASWLTHMFANFAINTIGLILFGII